MNTSLNALPAKASIGALEDRFGRHVAARLTSGTQEMPHDIGERLRIARANAVAHRRQPARQVATVGTSGDAALLGSVWWTRLGAIVPLVALVAGLLAISAIQDEDRASELADVDSALLTDDLPPAAYADPGFAQFLKNDAVNR